MNFVEEITRRNRELGLHLCVGLDPDAKKVHSAFLGKPSSVSFRSFFNFSQKIVEATKHVACLYKPNLWFWLAKGDDGLASLQSLVKYIHQYDIPVLLDTKFGDIGTTTEKAAEFFFDYLEVDAITANPYLGQDAIQPLLDRKDKGIIFICKTSNKGSADVQDRRLDTTTRYQHQLVWQQVADIVKNQWNLNSNCGLVVGATFPDELAKCRKIVDSDFPLLVPGVGRQGGDLEAAAQAALGEEGNGVFVINVSSGICHASDGPDFAEAAAGAAEKYHKQLLAVKV